MSLDFEIVEADGEWQIWTPDVTGGVLGTGATEDESKKNAAEACRLTAELLAGPTSVVPLRAWLAGQAIGSAAGYEDLVSERIAKSAVSLADAVIAELSKTK